MRLPFRLATLAVLCASSAFGQSRPLPADQLEAFERFAQRPTARVTWSEEIGRIETDRASAVVTALTIEDTAPNAERMRGIRIELTEAGRTDRLYTREEHLGRLIDGMQDMASAPGWAVTESENHCHGSGVFWMQSGHAFSASECVYGEWLGLVVHEGDFRFTGTLAEDFLKLFVAARNALSR